MAQAVPTTFIMARHGQTSFNVEGKICGGQSDPDLTGTGRDEAFYLGNYFAKNHHDLFETVYCSTLKRSAETAQVAFTNQFQRFDGRQYKFESIRDLREIDHGKSEGMNATLRGNLWESFITGYVRGCKYISPEKEIDPFLKWKITPNPSECHDTSFEGAETFESLIARVSKVMIDIAKQHPGKKIAIIAHNAVIQGLMMRSLHLRGQLEKGSDGLYPMFFERSLIPNCAVAAFECNPHLQESEDRIKFIKTEKFEN